MSVFKLQNVQIKINCFISFSKRGFFPTSMKSQVNRRVPIISTMVNSQEDLQGVYNWFFEVFLYIDSKTSFESSPIEKIKNNQLYRNREPEF